MAKLHYHYPEGTVCVVHFRMIEEYILGRLEAVCIVSTFRVETSGWLYSEPSAFRVNLSIGRDYIGSLVTGVVMPRDIATNLLKAEELGKQE